MNRKILAVIADMIDMILQDKMSTSLQEYGNTKIRVYRMYSWMVRIDLINTEKRPLTLEEWKPLIERKRKE